MSTTDFAMEGLKKLKELKDEELAIKANIAEKTKEASDKATAIYDELHKAGANFYEFIKKHEIFERSNTEIDIGSYHEHWVDAEVLSLFGQEVAKTFLNVHEFNNLPYIATSLDALKGNRLTQKRNKKDKVTQNLRNELSKVETKINQLESRLDELNNKIEKTSKRKPEFLFKGKLEKLKEERDAISSEIEDLNKNKNELNEQLQAYEDLHIFVSDEEVREDFELFQKIQKLIEEYRALSAEAEKKAGEVRYDPSKENEQLKDNRAAQTKVLEALLTPELLDAIETYAYSPDADQELVDVAVKVLKAGGRGSKRVSI